MSGHKSDVFVSVVLFGQRLELRIPASTFVKPLGDQERLRHRRVERRRALPVLGASRIKEARSGGSEPQSGGEKKDSSSDQPAGDS